MWGDEVGLFWKTEVRQNRNTGPRVLKWDVGAISAVSDWTCPIEYPNLDGPVAIDLETQDPTVGTIGPAWAFPGEGKVVGIAVATKDCEWYFPTQHEPGGNLDHAMTMRWLKAQLAKPTLEPIMANALYDVGWLWREGISVAGKIHDVQVMMALLDEHRLRYGLDSIGEDLLGIGKDEGLLIEAVTQAGGSEKQAKNLMWRLPPRFVGPYGERDARLTYDIWEVLMPRLRAEELLSIYALEQSMIPLSVKMRARGVRTDPDKAEQVRESLQEKERALVEEIKRATGVVVDAWDGSSIGRALRAEGVTPPQTATGRDSITKEWLEGLDTPVGAAVRRMRIYNKARTTFIDGHILGHARNGRIHCEFHQLRGESEEGGGRGTITGRWSSSNPNLQQIPKRDKEIRRLIRNLILPDEGHQWAALDYSSQEPRLTVHFAALANVEGGEAAAQRYRDDPRTDYHQMVADFCGIERDEAKPINLGVTYGMGGAKLCHSLGLPTAWCLVERKGGRTTWTEVDPKDVPEEQRDSLVEVAGARGKEILEKYHSGAPFVKGMIDMAQRRGSRRGYITTLLGRRSRFPANPRGGPRLELHAALNKLIQGSAADQTKRAMQILHEEFGIVPLITMHDELGLSVESYGDARFAANVMETAVELLVPSIVDVKLGPNWGDVQDADPTPSQGYGKLPA